MRVFAIYKIHFEQAGQKDCFGEDGVRTIDKAHEHFASLFVGNNVRVCKTGRQGEQIPLECDVERKHGDAMALFLCNEKNVRIPKKHEEKNEIAQPGCYILVYNRADVGLIAIERSAAFDSKPNKVRDILQSSFNSTLEQNYGIHLELPAKTNPEDFWKAVDKQNTEFNDTIKKVVFDFPDFEKTKSVDDPDDVQSRLEMMRYMAQVFGAKKAGLHLEASSKGTLKLDRTQEDMAQMVNLCCDNGYNLAVHFRNYGIYRHGQETKAMVTLNDDTLQEFITGQTICGTAGRGEFAITQWLEKVRHITETYNDEEPVKKKRKRGNRK